MSCRDEAVAQAKAALTETWQSELDRMQLLAREREAEMEAQIVRLMTQIEDRRREDASTVRRLIGKVPLDESAWDPHYLISICLRI